MKLKVLLLIVFYLSNIFSQDESIIKAINDSSINDLKILLDKTKINEQNQKYYIQLSNDVSKASKYKFKLNYKRGIYYPKPNIRAEGLYPIKGIGCLLLGAGSIKAYADNTEILTKIAALLTSGFSFYFGYKYLLKAKELSDAQLACMRTYEQIYLDSCKITELLKNTNSNNLI